MNKEQLEKRIKVLDKKIERAISRWMSSIGTEKEGKNYKKLSELGHELCSVREELEGYK